MQPMRIRLLASIIFPKRKPGASQILGVRCQISRRITEFEEEALFHPSTPE